MKTTRTPGSAQRCRRATEQHTRRILAIVSAVLLSAVVLSGCSPRLTRTEPAAASSSEAPAPAERPADAMQKWAKIHSGPYITPTTALESYSWAALVMGKNAPRCQIGWSTLAAIGKITTDHGTTAGHRLSEGSVVKPAIRRSSTPPAKDTDGGYYDGDPREDKRMGPLLFSPTVWEQWAITASKDPKVPPNPDSLDDAALTLARMLCGTGADMSTPDGWNQAVSTYNSDPAFLAGVNQQAKSYTD